MPAPRVPVEIREFPRPDLAPACAAQDGVSKCAAPTCTCGTGGSPACRIRSFPATSRRACSTRCAGRSQDIDGRALREGDASCSSTCTAPAAAVAPARSTGRRRAVRRAGSTASPTRPPTASSAAGPRRSISSPASSRGCPTPCRRDYIGGGCGLMTAVHIIERAALGLGDTVVVQGAGAVGLSTTALARSPARRRDRDRRAAVAARAGARAWAPTRGRLDGTTPESGCERARDDARPGRRRGHRGGRLGARLRRGPPAGARRRPLCHRRPLHERRRRRINAHEHINRKHLEIRGCWGSEARTLPARARRCWSASGADVPGAPSARGPTGSTSSTRRSPMPRRCGSRRRW